MLKSVLRSGFQTFAPRLICGQKRNPKWRSCRSSFRLAASRSTLEPTLAATPVPPQSFTPRVHAFEPTETANLLVRSMPRNVTVHRVDLSSRTGTATLRIPRSASALASLERHVTEDVRTIQVTLDYFVLLDGPPPSWWRTRAELVP
jgi:hypothetical protein